MATLGSLAVVARLSMTLRFSRGSRLNQTRVHRRLRVRLKKSTEGSRSTRSNLEPTAGKFCRHLQPPTSTENAGHDACEPHASLRALGLINRLRRGISRPNNIGASLTVGLLPHQRIDRKNINVKRVNC